MEIKTAKELSQKNLSNLQSKVNQDAPLLDVALLRVLSLMQGMAEASLYKHANLKILETMAETASLDGLKKLGEPRGIFHKSATAALLNISLPAGDGVEIPADRIFASDDNGERYFPVSSASGSGGVAYLKVTAENLGINGNLPGGSALTLKNPVSGAESVATVLTAEEAETAGLDMAVLGTEEEKVELYRRRVKAVLRKKSGGVNSGTVREWGESVPGVTAVYPYDGRPWNENPELSVPPERTIYVQADEDIEPEGIAPSELLDAVRASQNFTSEGKSRKTIGVTDEKLYLRSIIRIIFYVEIRGLNTPSGQAEQVKTAINSTVQAYFLSLRPFIQGLDFEGERNDTITDMSLSGVVQEVLKATNSSAIGVGVGTSPGFFLGKYVLKQGELAKLADPYGISKGIIYA